MNLENVKRDDWIVGGLAIVLIITLVSFPWFSIGGGTVGGISIPSFDFTGTDTPDGWLGVLAVIALIGVIADLAVERFSPQTKLPEIGGSRTMTRFVLAAAAAGFMALKFIFHIGHIGDLGWGFWLGAILAAALVFFSIQAHSAEGGTIGGGFSRPGAGGGSSTPTSTASSSSTSPASTPPASTPPASTPPSSPPAGSPSSEPPPSSPPPGS